jgi:predicted aspartyl protease
MRDRRAYALFLAAALAAVPAAAAEDCSLKMQTSVDTVTAASGGMLVPVTMAGAKKQLLLDTGGFFSEITPQTAGELGLKMRNSAVLQYDVSGQLVGKAVDVRDFSMGNLKAPSMEFMVGGGGMGGDGALAPNILQAYDVELDFPRNKLALISQDHCKGQVVHWQAAAVAAVPMRVTDAGHIVFPMTLDGRQVQAMLDTGAMHTTLSHDAAERIFGLRTRAASHRFKTLSFEGVTINNPDIALAGNITRAPMSQLGTLPSTDTKHEAPDLLLGMSTLKRLHVYIAYKEEMLYITAGEGAPAGRASGR